jgi:peptidyl-prolyl cis-trans isomerase SurA
MKLTSFFIFIFFVYSQFSSAVLLDKIAAIVDDNIITLSQIQRANKSLLIKKNIAPMVYSKSCYTNNEMLDISVNRFLIRAKLNELGFPVGDDQVEGQIKQNEKRLNVDRDQLRQFLKTQNATYDEYFETLREAMEYSYFVNKVVTPLISVSEQEIKNEFIQQNSKDARLNIKYTLIDYALPKDMKHSDFEKIVKSYRSNGVLPDTYSAMTASNLDDITEEGIASDLKTLLKSTAEGAISKVITISGQAHIFYVSKKDLVESENFTKQKEKIKDELFEKNVKSEVSIWFERERNKHFIKISL